MSKHQFIYDEQQYFEHVMNKYNDGVDEVTLRHTQTIAIWVYNEWVTVVCRNSGSETITIKVTELAPSK